MSGAEAAQPRPAATVVVVRPARSGEASAAEDPTAPGEVLLLKRHAGAGFMASVWVFPGGRVDAADHGAADAHAAAAVRETAEEAGVVLDGELVFCAHWVTPESEKKRFDTRFFLTVVPAGTEATPDTTEVTDALWLTAADALARHAAGGLPLAPPTWLTLAAIADASPEAALAWARAQRPVSVTPTLGLVAGRLEVRSPLGTLALVQGRWEPVP